MRIRNTLALAAAIVAAAGPCLSDTLRFDSFERGDREYSVLLGSGANHRIPSATESRFKFDAVKLRYGAFTSPRTQLALEFTTGIQKEDPNNRATWATTNYRRYFMVRGSTAVGYDISFGLLRLSHGVPELGTRINFTEQMGIVLQQGTGENSAWTLEYKFSHISNAGVRLPNIGINASIISLGYSWYN